MAISTVISDPMARQSGQLIHQKRISRLSTGGTIRLYSVYGRFVPFRQGGFLFKRATYQEGCLRRKKRTRGPDVWVYRYWTTNAAGKRVQLKKQIGNVNKLPTESAARKAVDALRITINSDTARGTPGRMSVQQLWDHYVMNEMPRLAPSTADCYSTYAKKWILPRWGNYAIGDVKTIQVERWLLDDVALADGSRTKIRTAMSTMYSHAVRWEFISHHPISSGVPVGSGGKRGPSAGVRVSSLRRKEPTVVTPEQFNLGLAKLDFRDRLLVFLFSTLATRRGEAGALQWQDCDLENAVVQIRHSFYWRRGGILKTTKSRTSAAPMPLHPILVQALREWKLHAPYSGPTHFVFASRRKKFPGTKPLDLAAVLKKKIQPVFEKLGVRGVGWHSFRHTVGMLLAGMGEHQVTIRDYLRHSNLSVTNKYVRAGTQAKTRAHARLVDAVGAENLGSFTEARINKRREVA